MEYELMVFKKLKDAEKELNKMDLMDLDIYDKLAKNGIAKIPNTVYIVVIDELGLLD